MKTSRIFNNWLSITGFILVVNSLMLILILYLISVFSAESNAYLGVYIYIVLPVFLVLGIILIPIGLYKAMRREKAGTEVARKWPMLDLNQPRHRRTLVTVSIITFIFLIISAIGSYQAFHYTESVEFCGKLCHTVMEPEFVTYQHSPHARVACVECHVGEGADWYVRSKLSGLYQVYATLMNIYPRPIPTPIKSLRPARETCERCHWPQKFYARKLRAQRSFLADENNTEWDVSLLMKIGPAYSAYGLVEGIHWHINNDFKIEYVSDVPDRENIPWIRYTNMKTGEMRIYQDEEAPLDQKALDTLEIRTMDCMDCHNRPSHLYASPPDYIDQALIKGSVSTNIPYIKQASMEALKNPFTNKDTAMAAIKESILAFYKTEHPEVYAARQAEIDKAISTIRQEYQMNAFPGMKADASRYLNHIGHLESNGCFRCHSDRHKTPKGQVISKDCNLCHTIIAQGSPSSMSFSTLNDTLGFTHPVTLRNDIWKTAMCSECHKSLYE